MATMPDRKSNRVRFWPLIATAVLAGCSGGEPDSSGSRYIYAEEETLRGRIADLAGCPSPLQRLGIDRTEPVVSAATPGEVIIQIPAGTDRRGSTVRFTLDSLPGQTNGQLHLRWTIALSSRAQELDLGEERLLHPGQLEKALDGAIEDFANYHYQAGLKGEGPAPDQRQLRQACARFGRVIDGIAVITNPDLRRTVERQKRRDALGWLFKDNYTLRTDSLPGAYWESEADRIPAPY